VLVPPAAQRERVHNIIYDELCLGEIRASSRAEYLAIIAGLAEAGSQAGMLLFKSPGAVVIHPYNKREL
ncbi:hypothetical protein ACQ4LF_23010, partial [Aeromonas salmonicida]